MAASQFYTSMFQQADDREYQPKKLLAYVLQGNAESAKKIYSGNPGLLLTEATAEEYAAGINENGKAVKRIISASPLRAMLGAGDIWMLEDALTALIQKNDKDYLRLASDEFEKQFPHGFDYPKSSYDFSVLANAITEDTGLVATGKQSAAINAILFEFRKKFMPDVVSCGHHFNLNELIAACNVYEDYWPRWTTNQRSLYWSHVIGYLCRLVTAVDAQILSQGIERLVVQRRTPTRCFELLFDLVTRETINYFPLDTNLSCRMGEHFAITSYFCGRARIASDPPTSKEWTPGSLLEPLKSIKGEKLAELHASLKVELIQILPNHANVNTL
ncbi:hypothetical protein [Legionella sp. CNM-4043-24]|uniref:hypothetical protein n=1 Tax=Legionella sp. CNM-4043-24 TaxID=3421646 RepID=UPI00403ADA29